jgi:hypothetical protein
MEFCKARQALVARHSVTIFRHKIVTITFSNSNTIKPLRDEDVFKQKFTNANLRKPTINESGGTSLSRNFF